MVGIDSRGMAGYQKICAVHWCGRRQWTAAGIGWSVQCIVGCQLARCVWNRIQMLIGMAGLVALERWCTTQSDPEAKAAGAWNKGRKDARDRCTSELTLEKVKV